MNTQIAQVVVGLPVEGPFDYSVHASLQKNIKIGQRVLVSFNRQKRIAYVVKLMAKSEFKKLNPIIEILENEPSITAHALEFTRQFSEHYGCMWGEAIESYLPKALRSKRVIALEKPEKRKRTEKYEKPFCLLHTMSLDEQYDFVSKEILRALQRKESSIVMVPEKETQRRIMERLKADFSSVLVFVKEKAKVKDVVELFQDLYSGAPRIFLGTRSAVFAPLPFLGLIAVFNEEHAAYKQEQTPNYHASELAKMRAKIEGARLILTSAIPSTEVWHQAQSSQWQTEERTKARDVDVQVIDMNNYNPGKSSIISPPLQNDLQKHMEENKKVLLFLNRRGFSQMTQCNQCGYQAKCTRCEIPMTYMFSKQKLSCRQCNSHIDLPKICPKCKSKYLRSMGSGVEKMEDYLSRFYPQARVQMFDRDTVKLHKKANLVIATQAIFRIGDEYQPDLVAALNIDSALHHFDYKSTHNVFAQLVHLYQMAGEKLVVQTKLPDMMHIKAIRKLDFKLFYKEDLKQRKELLLPPFSHILAVGVRGKKEEGVVDSSFTLFESLQENGNGDVEITDPQPDAIPKLRDQYRYTIMLKSKSLPKLHERVKKTLKEFKKRDVIVTLNVDP